MNQRCYIEVSRFHNCSSPAGDEQCPCMNHSRIIGIFLVRNEDRFIKQAINNVFSFCDQLLLVDHGSSDRTLEILRSCQQQHPEKVLLYQISHPRESHDLLKSLAGTPTWVFGVDGDELYDPERLAIFRRRLLSGEFDHDWMIRGNVLHVDVLNLIAGTASGYAAPPSRSITKLYNFAAIESWEGETLERLHGGIPQFRPGVHEQKKRQLQQEYSWEEAPLRCLHLCFVPRSSCQSSSLRKNIMETYAGGWLSSLRRFVRRLLCLPETSSWKQQHYARGERHTVEVTPFFKS